MENLGKKIKTNLVGKNYLNGYAILMASKTWENEDEFYNSKELFGVWKGYENSFNRTMEVYKKSKFIKAYMIPTDEYGVGGYEIHKVYQITEGLIFIKQCSISSILSNGAFRLVELYENGFIAKDIYFEKNRKSRDYLNKSGIVTQ